MLAFGALWETAASHAVVAKRWQPSHQEETRLVRFGERRKHGRLQSRLIDESSGLTPSRVHTDCYWTHNDNGKVAGLFLVDREGNTLARMEIEPAPFRDWEDIAGCTVEGKHFLVLADVGDNGRRHKTCRIHVFEEPVFRLPAEGKSVAELKVETTTLIEFSYPEGPRDCEAIAVDVREQKIILISKRTSPDTDKDPTTVHWIPLQLESTGEAVIATRMESEFQQPMVTGMDISTDGNLAVVRSYTSAWIYDRRNAESWAAAFNEPAARTLLPLQIQGEAVCFSLNGKSILLTSEGVRQPIWEIDVSVSSDNP